MNHFLDMLKESEYQSLSRYISVILLILFTGVTLYLVYNKYTWGNYDTFAFFTAGGGAGSQLVNKFINSKYNTKPGEIGKPVPPKRD